MKPLLNKPKGMDCFIISTSPFVNRQLCQTAGTTRAGVTGFLLRSLEHKNVLGVQIKSLPLVQVHEVDRQKLSNAIPSIWKR